MQATPWRDDSLAWQWRPDTFSRSSAGPGTLATMRGGLTMISRQVFGLGLLMLAATANAQSAITVGRTALASPGSGEPLAESWIAVNPLNAENIIVCASAKGGRASQFY